MASTDSRHGSRFRLFFKEHVDRFTGAAVLLVVAAGGLLAWPGISQAKEQRGGTFAVASEYTWRCHGPDRTGRLLGFVAAVQDDVVVVTVFDPDPAGRT